MRSINSLPIKNLVRKPARSLALIFISAFLALSAFGGTVMVMSLSNGINSLSARLGADIIVTPYAATSQVSYDSVIIQGKPGQFYMDSKYYEEIKTEIEGIDKITAQFYLASAKASCPMGCFTRGLFSQHESKQTQPIKSRLLTSIKN